MGNKNSIRKISGKYYEVPTSMVGYNHPVPPMLKVDDIRPPITWYEDKDEDDGFDWDQIRADHEAMENSISGGLSNTEPSMWSSSGAITPRSVLTVASLMTGPLSNRLMVTPSGRTISFLHQERMRSIYTKRGVSMVSAGSISLQFRRHNKSRVHLLSFEAVDEHARKAQNQHEKTFASLVDYLRQPFKFHQFAELMLARALIVWLAYEKDGTSRFIRADMRTPKGLIKMISSGKITHTEAYVVLCRSAGLQCVLIDGVSKPADIQTGNEEMIGDRWTAVHVEGEWQLVHPIWICKGIGNYGPAFDDWIRREVEAQGKLTAEKIKELKQMVKTFINEDYFMPAPEMFIHSNFPNDARWELLPPEYTVQSRDDFVRLPVLFPAFFRLGLRLLNEQSFELYSKDGLCKIWMATDISNAHRLTLTYELILLETHHPKSEVLIPNLNRQVVHSRYNDAFYFEVRFPVEGVFKLEIHGGYHKSHSMRLCYFKLVCDKRTPNFLYLPYDPEILMWGPGPYCTDVGLLLPSKPTGVIKVYEQSSGSDNTELRQPPTYKPAVFNFQLHEGTSKSFQYITEVHAYPPELAQDLASPLDENGKLVDKSKRIKNKKATSDIHPEDRTDYSFCAQCLQLEETKQLVINVLIPHDGEFALVIKAQPFVVHEDRVTKDYGPEVVVCVYLLRTVGLHKENVHQKLARSQLQRVMHGRNIAHIRGAIDKCIRVKINKNDDEIVEAVSKVEYLETRKGLMDAIHRRNIRVVIKQLVDVSQYKHKRVLEFEIKRLISLQKQLKKLQEFTKYIPELQRAGQELLHIENPPPEVHLTMGALFLLVEEPDKYIESWEYIRHQLESDTGQPGDSPIYRKMYLIAEMFPSKNTSRKILTLLTEYHFAQVKRVSVAAAKFYVWVQKVMAVLQDLEFYLEPDPGTKQIEVAVQGERMNQVTAPDTGNQQIQQPPQADILSETDIKL